MKKEWLLILASLFTLGRCDINLNRIDVAPKNDARVVGVASVDSSVQTIVDSMKDVSKEDAETCYKVFSGLALYLEQTKKVQTTLEAFTLVQTLQTDFGYTREKYKPYTDAVEKFLIDKGYKKVKKITDASASETEVVRSTIVADIRVIAEAAKVVMNGK
jgi:hypothetical protein